MLLEEVNTNSVKQRNKKKYEEDRYNDKKCQYIGKHLYKKYANKIGGGLFCVILRIWQTQSSVRPVSFSFAICVHATSDFTDISLNCRSMGCEGTNWMIRLATVDGCADWTLHFIKFFFCRHIVNCASRLIAGSRAKRNLLSGVRAVFEAITVLWGSKLRNSNAV